MTDQSSYEDVECDLNFLSARDCDCNQKGEVDPELHDRCCNYRLTFNAAIYK